MEPPATPRPAPTSFGGILRSVGPGLIVTANIVGTGELILTTKLGAETGFTLLWFLILGCFIKVFVQVELGRYTVAEGVSSLEALNRMPGPRARVSWIVWLWLFMYLGTLLQMAGMIVGIADLFATPGTGANNAWAIATALSLVALLIGGRYGLVEKGSTLMVVLFTISTLVAVIALQWTPSRIAAGDIAEGFSFRLSDNFIKAFGAFAITGVGAAELIFYPIWCLEKGYARNVGPRDDSPEWIERAKGWMRVMRIDAWLSMAIYTTATIAFYLLGAAVLHRQGLRVEDKDLIPTLVPLYEESFGTAGVWVFYVGAFMVLYSTVFVSTASNSRLFADVSGLLGLPRAREPEGRKALLRFAVVAIPTVILGLYFLWGKAVTMVSVGAIGQGIMLPFLGLAALYFRHRQIPAALRPGRLWTLFLWLAVATMVAVGLFNLGKTVSVWG